MLSDPKCGRKAVVHYRSGEVKRGLAVDFSPRKPGFHLNSLENPYGKSDFVLFDEVKAIFFVKNLCEASHDKLGKNSNGSERGNSVLVKFKDGEIIQGLCRRLTSTSSGFYVLPEDPYSNNESVFISSLAIDSIIEVEPKKPEYAVI